MVCGGYLAQLYMVKSFLVKHRKTRRYTSTSGYRIISASAAPRGMHLFVNISPKFTIPGLIHPPIALTKRPSLFRMAVRINSTVTLRRKMKID